MSSSTNISIRLKKVTVIVMASIIVATGITGCESSPTSGLTLTQAEATARLKSYFEQARAALPAGTVFAVIGSGDAYYPIACDDNNLRYDAPVTVGTGYVIENAGPADEVIATLHAYWTKQGWADRQPNVYQVSAAISPDGYRFSLSKDTIGLTIEAESPCSLATPITPVS